MIEWYDHVFFSRKKTKIYRGINIGKLPAAIKPIQALLAYEDQFPYGLKNLPKLNFLCPTDSAPSVFPTMLVESDVIWWSFMKDRILMLPIEWSQGSCLVHSARENAPAPENLYTVCVRIGVPGHLLTVPVILFLLNRPIAWLPLLLWRVGGTWRTRTRVRRLSRPPPRVSANSRLYWWGARLSQAMTCWTY